MKNRKITLGAIIFLLIVFLPITIFSTIKHIESLHPVVENPTHEFRYEGKLYFYDGDELLGKYTCETEACDYASTRVESAYPLNEKEVPEDTKLPIAGKRFVFIQDSLEEDPPILLYDLSLNRTIATYKEVKNYGVGIDNDYYILKDEKDLWGVVSFEEGIAVYLPFQYDYIGLTENVNTETEKVASDIFAVLKNNTWQLVDVNGATFTDPLNNAIINYNSEYIVLENNGQMQLVDYKNSIVLDNYKYINFYNVYLEVIDPFNQFYLYDLAAKSRISDAYLVNSIDDIELNIVDNEIQITYEGEMKETIAIE